MSDHKGRTGLYLGCVRAPNGGPEPWVHHFQELPRSQSCKKSVQGLRGWLSWERRNNCKESSLCIMENKHKPNFLEKICGGKRETSQHLQSLVVIQIKLVAISFLTFKNIM